MLVQAIIEEKLLAAFAPSHIEIINESDNHSGPAGRESHFKVIIVSDKFDGLMLIKRHRLVNSVLEDELANKIHALAMHTYTNAQWADKAVVPESPNCAGGSKG